MKLSFHGAAQTVTGSKHLITLETGETILLDCGMFQGLGKDTFTLNSSYGFKAEKIDHVILSHAHIDHSGLLPKLVKDGYRGNIYCTPATFELCELMLADSAYIQEADARFVNKRKREQGKELIEPLYTLSDVHECLSRFVTVPYDDEYKINGNIRALFTDNGHILGSAAVTLKLIEHGKSRSVFFSGDVGRYETTLLKPPSTFPQADLIICESTYGDRLHGYMKDAEQEILDAVLNTCSKKRGKLIIPAFSLGRTQEILFALNKLDLHGLLPDIKIYVDSPLSINTTIISRNHIDLFNEEVKHFIESRPDPFGFDDVTFITDVEESKGLNLTNEPCIIISASGMAEAGRVKHHIMHNISGAENTILIVGYAEPLSLAGKLRNGDKEVTIFGDPYRVNAEIKIIDSFSAHGDYKEMIRYLQCQDPTEVQKLFLVHGDLEAQKTFKEHLKDNGFNNIYIPSQHEYYFV